MKIHPARHPNEPFKKYQQRRKQENSMVDEHLRKGVSLCAHTIKSFTKDNVVNLYVIPTQYQPHKHKGNNHGFNG